MKRVTIYQILDTDRCGDYTDSAIYELAGGRIDFDIIEIGRVEIPAKDKIWLLIQLMDSGQVSRYVRKVALRALEYDEWRPDPRVMDYLSTGDSSDLDHECFPLTLDQSFESFGSTAKVVQSALHSVFSARARRKKLIAYGTVGNAARAFWVRAIRDGMSVLYDAHTYQNAARKEFEAYIDIAIDTINKENCL